MGREYIGDRYNTRTIGKGIVITLNTYLLLVFTLVLAHLKKAIAILVRIEVWQSYLKIK